MPDPNYSIGNLRAFADDLPHISRMRRRTATDLAVGARAVLNSLDLADDVDVRTLDRDDLLAQFETAEAGRLARYSLQTYKSAFRGVLEAFLRRQANEPDWDAPRRSTRSATAPAMAANGTPLVGHMFPLRDSITIRLSLPTNLTAAEADRMADFIKSLVISRHT